MDSSAAATKNSPSLVAVFNRLLGRSPTLSLSGDANYFLVYGSVIESAAQAMEALLLGRFEFDEVTLLLEEDATRDAIFSALQAMQQASTAGDVALFYYAGHGVQVDGQNYLIPVNAEIADEDEIELEGIDVNDFLRVMKSSNSQNFCIRRFFNCTWWLPSSLHM